MKHTYLSQPTVLVTGGAGYIGSHVTRDLNSAGYRVIVVDDLSTGNRHAILSGEFREGDIADHDLISELIRRHQIASVFHFAAHIEVEESMRDPLKYYQNNSWKALELIQTSLKSGVRHFVFSSTAAVYGIPSIIPVNEDAPLSPINPYGRSKLITEMLLADVSRANPDFRYIALRYFNVAGADEQTRIGQEYRNPTHLITRTLKTALGIYPDLKIFGTDYDTPDGTAIRDYIHVDDLASAHLLAHQYLLSGGESRIFNCGYGKGFSVSQVVEAAKRITGKDFPVIKADRRPGDPPWLIADSSRLQQTLNWRPRHTDIDQIIESAWRWELHLQKEMRLDYQNSR